MGYFMFIWWEGIPQGAKSSPWVIVRVAARGDAPTQRTEGTVFLSELWDVWSSSHVPAWEEISERRINMLIIEESKCEPRDGTKLWYRTKQLEPFRTSSLVGFIRECSCGRPDCLLQLLLRLLLFCLPARVLLLVSVWQGRIQPSEIHNKTFAVYQFSSFLQIH